MIRKSRICPRIPDEWLVLQIFVVILIFYSMLNLKKNTMNLMRKILGIIISVLFLFSIAGCEDDKPNPYKDDYEPNNKISSATDIVLGTLYNVSFTKGDRDFFRITVDNSGVIENLKFELGNFAENLAFEFVLLDELGNEIGTITGNPDGALIVYFPVIEGTYYVEIGDIENNAKGDYTLRISDLDDGDANEPNNTFVTATVIDTYPTGATSSTIVTSADNMNPSGDWDYFLVLVRANKKVDFVISPQAADLAMNFNIYDESQVLVDDGEDGAAGVALDYYLNNPTGADVTLYIKVGGTLGATFSTDYTISFTETDAN